MKKKKYDPTMDQRRKLEKLKERVFFLGGSILQETEVHAPGVPINTLNEILHRAPSKWQIRCYFFFEEDGVRSHETFDYESDKFQRNSWLREKLISLYDERIDFYKQADREPICMCYVLMPSPLIDLDSADELALKRFKEEGCFSVQVRNLSAFGPHSEQRKAFTENRHL